MSGEENCVKLCTSDAVEWTRFDLGSGTVEDKYIYPEEPYIEEIKSFIDAANCRNQSAFPNNLRKDHKILETLLEVRETFSLNH